MSRTPTEEQTRVKRAQILRAQQLAAQSEWEEAITLNREILEITPDDVASLNRLGKAYSELERFQEAFEAYSKALELDPINKIAERNVERLQVLKDQEAGTAAGEPERRHSQARQSMFIEEVGKTTLTNLLDYTSDEHILRMTSGDRVELRVEEKRVSVFSEDGTRLGRLPTRLALRLIKLIEGGNRYSGAVTAVGPKQLRIIIRETYQHPSQIGRLSFPVDQKPVTPRPFVREGQRTRLLGDDQDFTPLDDDDDEGDDETETEEEDEFTDEATADEPEEEHSV